jgi:hypothetical protein
MELLNVVLPVLPCVGRKDAPFLNVTNECFVVDMFRILTRLVIEAMRGYEPWLGMQHPKVSELITGLCSWIFSH